MKKSSRIMIGLVLAAVFAVPAGGCSKRAPDDENTLEIELYKAGYGETFLHALADEYEKNHEGVKIYINASSEESLIRTHLPSGPSNNTVDLYLQGDSYFDLMGETGGVDFLGVHYENKLADLTDVYNAVIPGENVTVKQKMFDDYEAYHNVGDGERGKYYQFPWAAGIGGITYNYNLFQANGWEVPNTTDELFALCERISAAELTYAKKKLYPFIFTLEDSYWDMAYLTWWAQYDGVTAFNKFWQGEYYDEEAQSFHFGPSMMLSRGKEEALKVLDRILCIDKSKSDWAGDAAYTDPDSVNTFMQVQTKYFSGGSAMMVNGDWLENEVRTDFEDELASGELDIRYMAMPVISSLGEKLGLTDAQLSAAVEYVRNGGEKPAISDDALTAVADACKINQTLGVNHNAVIPCYAKAEKLAKDFLVFMASDAAQEIYLSATKGAMLPFDYDAENSECYAGFSPFQKSKFEVMQGSKYVFNQSKHPLFYRGGVTPYSNLKTNPEVNLFNEKNYKNYKKITFENYDYVYKNWNDILRNSGIQA